MDQVLVLELRPGDVVVFDNLKPHLSARGGIVSQRAGATVLPLPPYSSDDDPIEELWSKFKEQLRRIAARTKDGLYKAVGEILDSVTIQDILGWFNHFLRDVRASFRVADDHDGAAHRRCRGDGK